MPRWTFVRHGQSVANAQGWFAGTMDAALTDLGESQARAARRAVLSEPFDRAYASDLQRAYRTAELVLEGSGLVPQRVPALRERHTGALQGRAIAEAAQAGDSAVLSTWEGRPPGGESLLDTTVRAVTWLASVDDDIDTLVVAHGALIRAVVGSLDGLDHASIIAWRPRNCEVVARALERGGWRALLERLT